MGKVFIGTSGYNYNHWKKVFYPQDLSKTQWLSYYSKHFNTVEINATFYGSFKKETFEKWAEQTSSSFTFVIKGSRFITHIKRLKDVVDPIKRFFNNASGLGKKLSVAFWQFPKNFQCRKEEQERLKIFISGLPGSVRHAFEFRHESWFNDQVFNLLNNQNTGFVISDSPNIPKKEIVVGGFCYIRFHGQSSLYSSSYSDIQLKSWARKINKYRRKYDVYCYFNNDTKGFAVKNAKTLKKFL